MPMTWGNRWQNVRELTPGGQAHTFIVVDVEDSSRTERVLKRLKNTSDARLARFQSEIDAVKTLKHPNIVELFDFNLQAEQPYLVTEYCNGGSLADVDVANVPAYLLRTWFADIAGALEAAHRAGFVHRDIKPDNVFLRSPTGPAVLGDFGLVYDEDQDRVTLTFEQVGSRFFMAPELREGRAPGVHAVSDIYSLGKVLYWMFSGGKMFDRENHRDSSNNLVKIRQDYYFEHLNRVLDRMITFDPGRRFERARTASEATLEAWALMDGRYNALSRADQLCRYCGRGFYMRMPEDSYFTLGLNSGAINTSNFRILCCTVCGNLQNFWAAGADETDWISTARVPTRR